MSKVSKLNKKLNVLVLQLDCLGPTFSDPAAGGGGSRGGAAGSWTLGSPASSGPAGGAERLLGSRLPRALHGMGDNTDSGTAQK